MDKTPENPESPGGSEGKKEPTIKPAVVPKPSIQSLRMQRAIANLPNPDDCPIPNVPRFMIMPIDELALITAPPVQRKPIIPRKPTIIPTRDPLIRRPSVKRIVLDRPGPRKKLAVKFSKVTKRGALATTAVAERAKNRVKEAASDFKRFLPKPAPAASHASKKPERKVEPIYTLKEIRRGSPLIEGDLFRYLQPKVEEPPKKSKPENSVKVSEPEQPVVEPITRSGSVHSQDSNGVPDSHDEQLGEEDSEPSAVNKSVGDRSEMAEVSPVSARVAESPMSRCAPEVDDISGSEVYDSLLTVSKQDEVPSNTAASPELNSLNPVLDAWWSSSERTATSTTCTLTYTARETSRLPIPTVLASPSSKSSKVESKMTSRFESPTKNPFEDSANVLSGETGHDMTRASQISEKGTAVDDDKSHTNTPIQSRGLTESKTEQSVGHQSKSVKHVDISSTMTLSQNELHRPIVQPSIGSMPSRIPRRPLPKTARIPDIFSPDIYIPEENLCRIPLPFKPVHKAQSFDVDSRASGPAGAHAATGGHYAVESAAHHDDNVNEWSFTYGDDNDTLNPPEPVVAADSSVGPITPAKMSFGPKLTMDDSAERIIMGTEPSKPAKEQVSTSSSPRPFGSRRAREQALKSLGPPCHPLQSNPMQPSWPLRSSSLVPAPDFTSSPQPEIVSSSQALYGQSSYRQSPHGQSSYTRFPYAQRSPVQLPYMQPQYSQSADFQSPYAQSSYLQSSHPESSYSQAAYAQGSPLQSPHLRPSHGQDLYAHSPSANSLHSLASYSAAYSPAAPFHHTPSQASYQSARDEGQQQQQQIGSAHSYKTLDMLIQEDNEKHPSKSASKAQRIPKSTSSRVLSGIKGVSNLFHRNRVNERPRIQLVEGSFKHVASPFDLPQSLDELRRPANLTPVPRGQYSRLPREAGMPPVVPVPTPSWRAGPSSVPVPWEKALHKAQSAPSLAGESQATFYQRPGELQKARAVPVASETGSPQLREKRSRFALLRRK